MRKSEKNRIFEQLEPRLAFAGLTLAQQIALPRSSVVGVFQAPTAEPYTVRLAGNNLVIDGRGPIAVQQQGDTLSIPGYGEFDGVRYLQFRVGTGSHITLEGVTKQVKIQTRGESTVVVDGESFTFAKEFTFNGANKTGFFDKQFYDLKPPTNWFDTAIVDEALRTLGSSLYQDGLISRVDVMALFTSAGDGGVVDAQELADLTLMVNTEALYGDLGYVKSLASYVVKGSALNAKYQGATLGNLKAGSTADQLQLLVNKHFLGLDRPASGYGYVETAGVLFVDGASYSDCQQGAVGNCGEIVAFAAVAYKSPGTIESMFTVNGDGTYTVRFYIGGVAEYVTVDSYLPNAGTIYGRVRNGELWMALAEKASAQLNEDPRFPIGGTGNSYASIAATYIYAGLQAITGQSASAFNALNETTFAAAVGAGKTIGVATKSVGTQYMVANHAYVVLGYDQASQLVHLYNPWGSVVTVSWAQLKQDGVYYDWV